MTNFGLANMDYVPVKFMIKCFEANYPESLGSVLIHRAPWIFQGIWRVIRGWLDPVVASKIHFTNSAGDLAGYLPEDKILKELGGRNPYSFAYTPPVAGEDDRLNDQATRETLETKRAELVSDYEDVVRDWISSDQLSSQQEAANKSRTRRAEVAAELANNYWQLDPYVRARSVYDRTGAIEPNLKAPPPTLVTPKSTDGPGFTPTTLAVPVGLHPSSASVSGRSSTSSRDVFVDAEEHLD
jgi:CRAL/TRIO domain